MLTLEGGVSKIAKKVLTYFIDAPFSQTGCALHHFTCSMYNIAIAIYRLLFSTMVGICEISAKIEYNQMLGFAVKSNFKIF